MQRAQWQTINRTLDSFPLTKLNGRCIARGGWWWWRTRRPHQWRNEQLNVLVLAWFATNTLAHLHVSRRFIRKCWSTCTVDHGWFFRLDALALSVIATATWLAVTLRYCINTAEPIRKLFRPSESPITLVFWDPCADTKFHGEPLHRGR